MQISNVHMDDHSIVVGAKKTHTFGITDNAAFLHNLSDTLYSDKLLAAIREPICNAWDAHTDAGIKDTPILVTLTQDYVEIKDFGKGISKEDFPTIYGVYGGSTKQTDNSQTGGFGLGCKAPFAYTDTFTVTSIYNEVKTIYSLNKISVAGGKPAISEILSVPTEEHSGLTVQIPLKEAYSISSGELKSILEVISFTLLGSNQSIRLVIDYEHIKFDEVLTSGTIKFSENIEYTIYEFNGDDFTLRATKDEIMKVLNTNDMARAKSDNLHVLVSYANVLYPLDTDSLSTEARDLINMMDTSYCTKTRATYNSYGIFIIRVEPGTLAITPSRESLSYNNTTINNLSNFITDTIKKEFTEVSDRVVKHYGEAMDAILTEQASTDQNVHLSLFSRYSNTLREEFNEKAKELYPNDEVINFILDNHSFGLTPFTREHFNSTFVKNNYWCTKEKYLLGIYRKHLYRIVDWAKEDIKYNDLVNALMKPIRKHGLENSFYYLDDIRKSIKIEYILDNRYNISSGDEIIHRDNILDTICPSSMFIVVSRTKAYIQRTYKSLVIPNKSAALTLTAKQYEDKDKIFKDLIDAGYFIKDITESELEYKELLRQSRVSASKYSSSDSDELSFATSVRKSLNDRNSFNDINTVSKLTPINTNPKYVWVVDNGSARAGYLNTGLSVFRSPGSDSENVLKFILDDFKDGEDAAFVSTQGRADKLMEDLGIVDVSTYFKDTYVIPYLSDDSNLIKFVSELLCAPSTSKGGLVDSIRYSARAIEPLHPVSEIIYKIHTLNDVMNRDGLYNSIRYISSDYKLVFGWLEDIAPQFLQNVLKPFYEESLEGNDTIINLINLLLSKEHKDEVCNYIISNISRIYLKRDIVEEFKKLSAVFFSIKEYLTWPEPSYWDKSRIERIFNDDTKFFNDSLTKLHELRNKMINQFIEEIKNV